MRSLLVVVFLVSHAHAGGDPAEPEPPEFRPPPAGPYASLRDYCAAIHMSPCKLIELDEDSKLKLPMSGGAFRSVQVLKSDDNRVVRLVIETSRGFFGTEVAYATNDQTVDLDALELRDIVRNRSVDLYVEGVTNSHPCACDDGESESRTTYAMVCTVEADGTPACSELHARGYSSPSWEHEYVEDWRIARDGRVTRKLHPGARGVERQDRRKHETPFRLRFHRLK